MSLFIRIAYLVAFAGSICFSQQIEIPELDGLVMKGIDATLRQDYPLAKRYFRTAMNLYPEHPVGYINLAGVLQAEFADFRLKFNEQLYDSLLSIGLQKAEALIDSGKKDWGYYYSGTTYAYRSYTASEFGYLPKALILGLNAASRLQHCLEVNPKFYAAKNILGSYYFWRSTLSWIPFISDQTDEGIALIQDAVRHSPYERVLGKNNLIIIYTEKERYDDALSLGEEVLREYPSNRNFLWSMMRTAEKAKNNIALQSIVRRLLESSVNAPVRNVYREALCRIQLAKIAFANNDIESARAEIRHYDEFKEYLGKTYSDLSPLIDEAMQLKKRIQ